MTSPGILLVDKPKGPTSHDVVARVRRLAQTRKVGHAGTLDPAATGLLVLGLNRGTKLLHFLTGLDKSYRATVRLGASTITDDAEGEVISDVGTDNISSEEIGAALEQFRGPILQVPASVSAIKVGGKRAHSLVRSGHSVDLPSRPVTITGLEMVGAPIKDGKYLDFEIEVDCSSGTYVRSLARDIGAHLGVGGHLTGLRRTRVGPWSVEQAKPLEEMAQPLDLISLGSACAELYPHVLLAEAETARVRHGQGPLYSGDEVDDGQLFALLDQRESVVGLGKLKGGTLRPVFIIDPA